VGRAGRGAADASVVLVPTPTEGDIWAYFDATAMPERHVVEEVLATLQSSGPCTLVQLEGLVNLRRGRLEALLKVLDVEGAVDRDGSAWFRTDRPWAYDDERYRTLATARRAEQDAMRRYRSTAGCRLRFLREALDDPGAQDCGRCDNCTGTAVPSGWTRTRWRRPSSSCGEPRSGWSRASSGPRPGGPQGQHRPGPAAGGGPGPGLRHGSGVGGDLGAPVRWAGRPTRRRPPPGVAATLKAWDWGRRPTWVTWIPSRSRPQLVAGLAERLAQVGKLDLVDAVRRVRADAPPQSRMENSAVQAANVLDAFEFATGLPAGPGLVVDDAMRSGWTMTVVAEGLRSSGAGLILPFVLWRRP